MKSKYTQKRYRAQKSSSCAMCKPEKRNWADKKTVRDLKKGVDMEQQIKDTFDKI